MQIPMMKREWLYAALALAGGMLGGFASGKLSSTAAATVAQTPQRTIAAQDILLVDAKGNTRGAFRLNKDGDPGLALYDHDGKLRTTLQMSNDDGLGFKLSQRISLTINADAIPALRLFDSQGHPRALLGVDPDGEAALDFYSQQAKLLRELP